MSRKRYRPRIEGIDAGTALITAMQVGAPRELADAVRDRFDSGAGYLGPRAYSLVSSLTNFSLPQRLIGLRSLDEEAARLLRSGRVGREADADERLKMLNWQAAVETALLIGDLAALLAAVERWRNGGDLATAFLEFERVAPTIARNDWRSTKVWHRLLGYAGDSSLDGLGMTSEQRKSFKKVAR